MISKALAVVSLGLLFALASSSNADFVDAVVPEESNPEDVSTVFMGGVTRTSCSAVRTSGTWSTLPVKWDLCEGAWMEAFEEPIVWIKYRATLEAYSLVPKDAHELLEHSQGGDGHVFFTEPSVDPVSGDKSFTDQTGSIPVGLANRFEVFRVAHLDNAQEMVSVPDDIKNVIDSENTSSAKYSTGYIAPTAEELAQLEFMPEPTELELEAVPNEFDWTRSYPSALANKIENQGQCGSCWAFGGV
jgi:hypothetical protein